MIQKYEPKSGGKTVTEDIPELKKHCLKILNEQNIKYDSRRINSFDIER